MNSSGIYDVNTNNSIATNTTFSNILVSGSSTLLSSLNVVGNIIGSGTALTNLNYNAITNKPDLTVYVQNETLERQYPPKTWDTTENITSITYNGFPAFNINCLITTAQYANGPYSVSFSNRFTLDGVSYESFATKSFDYDLSNSGDANFLNTSVVGFNSSGDYIGDRYLAETSFKDEWVFIKLPDPIMLTKYIIVAWTAWTQQIIRNPALWRIYGSNDGIIWEEIIDASNSTTRLTVADYTNNDNRYTKTLNKPSKLYNYIGMCINKTVSSTELQFIEIDRITIIWKRLNNFIIIKCIRNNKIK